MIGVPLLLVASFLGALDNSYKEKITHGVHSVTPNEILYYTNFFAVILLSIYTFYSGEFIGAISFIYRYPSTLYWMLLRGMTYALWIHWSVVLIQKGGALLNQYVSASRKVVSVLLSFLIFNKSLEIYHWIGILTFATACLLKVYLTYQKKSNYHNSNNDTENKYRYYCSVAEEKRIKFDLMCFEY